ncbi:DDB1- and CUL4-associated factor 8-like protein 1 [Capsicum baccatum]|uniref:DDB1-and CUL4-associated factor 8-like protein 1 n=1 Tax=Capsicum baccatum TaxID=33114 RepID=A0A2G2WIW8_CAPBA|nr:DDB1- and CUL4-associated factor 8-like protein 1 [Capsicum baccatum]
MGLGPSPLSSQGEDAKKLVEPQLYSGHRNSRTIKGVSFFGPSDEYVLSGSDCGYIFIWMKKGAELVRMMVGDRHIVNQLAPYPYIPVLATRGIEKTIKLWTPSSNNVTSLPRDVQKVHSLAALLKTIHVEIQNHRRQPRAYVERRHNRDDIESDEDDGGEAYVLGISDGDTEGASECSII